jgi:hypothetical protein
MRNFKVFGVPLSISIQYAGIAAWVRNLLVPVDAEMKLKVPIVVEECCTFLVTRGEWSLPTYICTLSIFSPCLKTICCQMHFDVDIASSDTSYRPSIPGLLRCARSQR